MEKKMDRKRAKAGKVLRAAGVAGIVLGGAAMDANMVLAAELETVTEQELGTRQNVLELNESASVGAPVAASVNSPMVESMTDAGSRTRDGAPDSEARSAADDAETVGTQSQESNDAANDGAANDGAGNDGAANDGAANDGAGNDGAGNDGAANDGAANDGGVNDGAGNDGGVNDDAGNTGSTAQSAEDTGSTAGSAAQSAEDTGSTADSAAQSTEDKENAAGSTAESGSVSREDIKSETLTPDESTMAAAKMLMGKAPAMFAGLTENDLASMMMRFNALSAGESEEAGFQMSLTDDEKSVSIAISELQSEIDKDSMTASDHDSASAEKSESESLYKSEHSAEISASEEASRSLSQSASERYSEVKSAYISNVGVFNSGCDFYGSLSQSAISAYESYSNALKSLSSDDFDDESKYWDKYYELSNAMRSFELAGSAAESGQASLSTDLSESNFPLESELRDSRIESEESDQKSQSESKSRSESQSRSDESKRQSESTSDRQSESMSDLVSTSESLSKSRSQSQSLSLSDEASTSKSLSEESESKSRSQSLSDEASTNERDDESTSRSESQSASMGSGEDPILINDEGVPLSSMSGEEEPVVIDDEDVPLAVLEEDPVAIDDEEVPLASVPKTGDISPLWNAGAALSAGGLAALGRRKKR